MTSNSSTRRVHADTDILHALRSGGFVAPGATPDLERLTGGVSSDVFRLQTPSGPVCVKRALSTLRVAAVWEASVERSHYEVEWLRTARPLLGDAVPEVLFEDRQANLLVMNFYEPATHRVWKSDLAAGRIEPAFAGQVGAMLARVHSGTAGRADIAARFRNTDLFEDLRLAPYLRHSANAHPELAERLLALADRTAATRRALVHGDVSPKNILCGPAGPVFLDAECAWFGDPAFDLAFCSTHLLLKCVWKPAHADGYLASFESLHQAYFAGVDWEPAASLESRAAELTAAILLARVDGKSPVEYLQTDADRGFVRATARELITGTPATLAELSALWKRRRNA
jgi:aminoglycoside phosphotransferase (APT) family kinase protein